MGERFDNHAIERTQPGPSPTTHDPGKGLREHVEASKAEREETAEDVPRR